MKVLVFAGAGTSVELGVPAMTGMAEEFLAHTKQWDIEPDLVQKLISSTLDIEHLIESLDLICTARSPLELIGEASAHLDRADKIRAEVEWFVQHAAERVNANDAKLMWGAVLRTVSSNDITLVTTNYDRAIELAANAETIPVDDGFAPFAQGETALWVGFNQNGTKPRLLKLHGSTDWYAAGENRIPTKLRHPMPLFGRAALRLTAGDELGSALVLPSREKILNHSPYPRLSQTFLNEADSCDLAVFVGSSLRDRHIREAADTITKRAPVYLVNPSGDTYGLEKVKAIKQYASSFLISTLPNALISSDPVAALESTASTANDNIGALIAVKKALDSNALAYIRCSELEHLDEIGLTLDPYLLKQLLADPDTSVARYTLGLISRSPARSTLVEYAAATSHANEDAFKEDLQLLLEMIG